MLVHAVDSGECPAGFVQVNGETCYSSVSKKLDWWQAVNHCCQLHPDAYPVAINDEQEQEAVLAVSSLLGKSINQSINQFLGWPK